MAQNQPYQLGLQVHAAQTIVHSQFVQFMQGSSPYGVTFMAEKYNLDTTCFKKYKCLPNTGWAVNYNNYNHTLLGSAINAYYFLQPTYKINSNFLLQPMVGLGFGYMSRPFNAVTNPQNISISLPVNAHFFAQLNASTSLNKQWLGKIGVGVYHNSNGGVNKPNRGINYVAISAAIVHQSSPIKHLPNIKKYSSQNISYNKHLQFQIKSFYGIKNIDTLYYGQYNTPVYGLSAKVIKPLNAFHNLSLGIAWCYDKELEALNNYHQFAHSHQLVNVFLGHEFVFNKWIVSTDVGLYINPLLNSVQKRYKTYSPISHHWGFSRKISSNIWLGGGFKAHQHIADFIDAHLIYRW